MPGFSVGFHPMGAVEVLILVGELDAHTISEFDAALQHCIQKGRYKIIVDCTKLSYISSAGLGAFVGHIEEVRSAGGDIKIAALTPKVFDVFDMLGLNLLFDITGSREEALNLFVPEQASGGA